MTGKFARTRRDVVHDLATSVGVTMTDEVLTEYDSIFCANTGCVLHVRPGDPNVRGSGNWAQFEDGTIIGRRRVESTMLCDRCAARVMRGEVTLATRLTAAAA
jgi:hypothetical protein